MIWKLRRIAGKLTACIGSYGMRVTSRSRSVSGPLFALPSIGALAMLLMIVLIPLLALSGMFHAEHALQAPHMLGAVMAVGNTLAVKEDSYKTLMRELVEGKKKLDAGELDQNQCEALESKMEEAKGLQTEIDRSKKLQGVIDASRRPAGNSAMPTDDTRTGRKRIQTTTGHIFVASEQYKRYKENRKDGWSQPVEYMNPIGQKQVLFGEDAAKFEEKAFDIAQLSNLGTDAILQVDRDPEIVRWENRLDPTISDVLGSSATTSDSIEYVRLTGVTGNAASQATRGGLKPFMKVALDKVNTPVVTIAALSKVTEQDIDDAPRLITIINGEMSDDVRREREQQILWGSGGSGELKGLFHADNNIPEFDRADTGDTLIDSIRKMRTDLRKKRENPLFVAIAPEDWEEIELLKGTDSKYVWGLITDLRGPRIWSLPVVETEAMTNPDTQQRRILMGNGARGATVYTRKALTLALGMMDDDFARNLRTMRAEERVALAVKRSFAFEYMVSAGIGS